jgi:hypothetical protein
MASKLSRELQRVYRQVSEFLSRGYDRWRTGRYDCAAERLIRVVPGRLAAGEGLAIYLIYQPDGLSPSTLIEATHLARRGYPAIIVSNAPLSPEDLERLSERSVAVVIRPNVGYDFGGYRDGLRYMDSAGLDPERLIMVNDSIWFPLRADETLVTRMEAAAEAFQGAHYELKGKRTKSAHYESYFFLIRREARQSAAFRSFWRDYPMSSTRWKVLRRGEKGFSQAMFKAGFAPKGIASRQAFSKAIEAQDADFLRKTLLYASYEDPAARSERDSLLAGADASEDWRRRAVDHIRKVSAAGTYHDAFRYAVEMLFDMPILKKRRLAQTVEMRRQYLRAVAAGDLPAPDPHILDEIRASIEKA